MPKIRVQNMAEASRVSMSPDKLRTINSVCLLGEEMPGLRKLAAGAVLGGDQRQDGLSQGTMWVSNPSINPSTFIQ